MVILGRRCDGRKCKNRDQARYLGGKLEHPRGPLRASLNRILIARSTELTQLVSDYLDTERGTVVGLDREDFASPRTPEDNLAKFGSGYLLDPP